MDKQSIFVRCYAVVMLASTIISSVFLAKSIKTVSHIYSGTCNLNNITWNEIPTSVKLSNKTVYTIADGSTGYVIPKNNTHLYYNYTFYKKNYPHDAIKDTGIPVVELSYNCFYSVNSVTNRATIYPYRIVQWFLLVVIFLSPFFAVIGLVRDQQRIKEIRISSEIIP
jgi:hypothetical protein